MRPKAASAAARAEAQAGDGEVIRTVPRGWYLRARFTEQLLWEATGHGRERP